MARLEWDDHDIGPCFQVDWQHGFLPLRSVFVSPWLPFVEASRHLLAVQGCLDRRAWNHRTAALICARWASASSWVPGLPLAQLAPSSGVSLWAQDPELAGTA